LAGRAVRQSNDRNFARALTTGVVLAGVVSGVFLLGALPVAIMVLVVLGLAGAEAYAGFRSAGAHPATVLGIVAILTLGVAVYNKGLTAVGAISVLLVIFGFVWYLNAGRAVDVLDGLGATVFVYVWIGVIGSYALLFVAPHSFVARARAVVPLRRDVVDGRERLGRLHRRATVRQAAAQQVAVAEQDLGRARSVGRS
jgi:hypothetical protein